MLSANSLGRSLVLQRRVIGALLLREILTRYGRHNIGFLWLFVEPMTFTIGVTIMWNVMNASHGSNLPITSFAITGYSTVLLWRNMPARCIAAIEPNASLLFHRYVKVIDIFLSRLILEAIGATLSFAILSIIFVYVGWVSPPEDVLKVAAGWLMTAWFGMSLGLLLGSLTERSELVDKIWHPTSYLLFPLSGAAFAVDVLPKGGQEAILYLPMVHGVELLREGFFGSQYHAHYDIAYMTMVNLALTFLALFEVRRVSQRVIPL
jgi:ABC-2 type transport system permease protein/capsular polysaccharide transport system permease protein